MSRTPIISYDLYQPQPIQARTRNLSTGENVQKWTRYFLLLFSDASKMLASTFGRIRLYRLRFSAKFFKEFI